MKALCMLLLVLFIASYSGTAISTDATSSGTLMLVGETLTFKQRAVWKRVFELAGGDIADVVIIAAAHNRAKLYGGYAKQALTRYGPLVELLPLAVSADEFGIDYQQAARNPDLVKQVQEADAVFFVGGAPQHLTEVLLSDDGSATPLAAAISEVYAAGGVIVGGIPGTVGTHTGIDAMLVLEQGHIPEQLLYRGLGFISPGWYIDQHFFSAGRFAETLVTMRQLGMNYGIGVGANAAAVIKNGQLEAVGGGGVMIVDLSETKTAMDDGGFRLKGARLSYFDDGDRVDLKTLQVTQHPNKLDGFEINPNVPGNDQPLGENRIVIPEMFAHNRVAELLLIALDSERGEAIGLAFPEEADENDTGFQFRFYVGRDTIGWLTRAFGKEQYTAQNIYLDIAPLTRQQADDLIRKGTLTGIN